MQKQIAQILGILVAGLAVLGLFVENGHLFGLMNANIPLDMLRFVLAAALLYAGYSSVSPQAVRSVLMFTGVLYLGLALLGLISSTLWGILPSGLTGFDVVFHLVAGAIAAGSAIAAASSTHHPSHA